MVYTQSGRLVLYNDPVDLVVEISTSNGSTAHISWINGVLYCIQCGAFWLLLPLFFIYIFFLVFICFGSLLCNFKMNSAKTEWFSCIEHVNENGGLKIINIGITFIQCKTPLANHSNAFCFPFFSVCISI